MRVPYQCCTQEEGIAGSVYLYLGAWDIHYQKKNSRGPSLYMVSCRFEFGHCELRFDIGILESKGKANLCISSTTNTGYVHQFDFILIMKI